MHLNLFQLANDYISPGVSIRVFDWTGNGGGQFDNTEHLLNCIKRDPHLMMVRWIEGDPENKNGLVVTCV